MLLIHVRGLGFGLVFEPMFFVCGSKSSKCRWVTPGRAGVSVQEAKEVTRAPSSAALASAFFFAAASIPQACALVRTAPARRRLSAPTAAATLPRREAAPRSRGFSAATRWSKVYDRVHPKLLASFGRSCWPQLRPCPHERIERTPGKRFFTTSTAVCTRVLQL
jgi:hypothetical protein